MSREPMPQRFERLAEYNANMAGEQIRRPAPEYGEGTEWIEFLPADPPKYTAEYHARMAALQEDFNQWQRARLELEGDVIEMPGGGLLILPRRI